eukprot:6461035-Amphidinium_carterae.1
MAGWTRQRGWHRPAKRKPRRIPGAGSAQPDLLKPVTLIPSRHRARGTAHPVFAQVDSGMGTWAHFRPCKLGPPGVPHTPSDYSNSTAQVVDARCRSTHTHNTRPARAQSGEWTDRDRDQSLANIVVPIHSGAPALSKAPWCSFGPAQIPGLPRGIHQGSIGDTARR